MYAAAIVVMPVYTNTGSDGLVNAVYLADCVIALLLIYLPKLGRPRWQALLIFVPGVCFVFMFRLGRDLPCEARKNPEAGR